MALLHAEARRRETFTTLLRAGVALEEAYAETRRAELFFAEAGAGVPEVLVAAAAVADRYFLARVGQAEFGDERFVELLSALNDAVGAIR